MTEYQPKIEKWAGKVLSPETQAEEKRKVAGQIRGEIMKNVDPSKVFANPVETAKRLSGLAGIETGAQVKGTAAIKKRELGEMQNLINIGRGEAATAEAGTEALAGQSVATAIMEKEAEQQAGAATDEAIAGGIGTGIALLTRPKTPTTEPDYYEPDYYEMGGARRGTRNLYPQNYFSWGGTGQNF